MTVLPLHLTLPQSSLSCLYSLIIYQGSAWVMRAGKMGRREEGRRRLSLLPSSFPSSPLLKSPFQSSTPNTNNERRLGTSQPLHCKCSWTFAWLGSPRKMAIPSQVGDVKIVARTKVYMCSKMFNVQYVIFFLSRIRKYL